MGNTAKILVIDDDPDFLEAMKVILKSYQIVTASNPKEGIDMIVSERPDLILLDIMMDNVFDGFSICHTLKTSKEYQKFRHVPIIFVSAMKEDLGSRFTFKGNKQDVVGADDYIDKPVKAADLVARIERLLKK